MTTIYDVAKAAGVSTTTVSRVLNNYVDISPDTKRKILKTINNLGYIPNPSARSLTTKRSYLIGILFAETLNVGIEHPFFAGVIEGFKKVLAHHGYDTMFIVNKFADEEIGYLQHCKLRGVDGVCVFANTEDVSLDDLLSSDIKLVTTELVHDRVPRIASDNVKGAKLAINHFIKNHHTRIGYILAPLSVLSSHERYEGIKEALSEVNMNLDEEYISFTKDYHINGGYHSAKELFERFTYQQHPTALFVVSDIVAIGVIKYLQEIGKRIPEDVEIIGFDNIELASQITPKLSTVAQNRFVIGEQAAYTLLALLDNSHKLNNNLSQKIEVELILRETTTNDSLNNNHSK